jgi:hypothetical protein
VTLGRQLRRPELPTAGARWCEAALPEGSVYRFLARERARLFPPELFADLFAPTGRRSVPPSILAVVMVLQRLEGLSDREAADRFAFDVRWRYAAGVADPVAGEETASFAHTVLVDLRARLRRSADPDRIFRVTCEGGVASGQYAACCSGETDQVSDRQGQLVERDGQAQGHRLLHRQFVMRSTEVLDKRVPSDDDPGTAVPLEPTHRSQSRLERAVIGLDVVVGVPIGTMPGRREQLVQHRPVRCSLVGHNFHRDDRRGADGLLEEALGGVRVATRGDERVDDLPELVDRAVNVAPLASHLHVGLVDLPAVPDGMPAGPGGVGQQGREPLDPPVDGDVVNVEAAFGEEFLDVAVGL